MISSESECARLIIPSAKELGRDKILSGVNTVIFLLLLYNYLFLHFFVRMVCGGNDVTQRI